jgi:hypothetical protein
MAEFGHNATPAAVAGVVDRVADVVAGWLGAGVVAWWVGVGVVPAPPAPFDDVASAPIIRPAKTRTSASAATTTARRRQ